MRTEERKAETGMTQSSPSPHSTLLLALSRAARLNRVAILWYIPYC